MKTKTNILAGLFLLLFVSTQSRAQDLRTFNQNSSRSNRFSNDIGSGFNLTFSPVFSAALNKSNDSLLFRGNGGGFKMDGDYFFGKAGIGFSSGFGSSAADENAINNFLIRNNIKPQEVSITKSNQQNMYLLLGPSVRFGSKVAMLLHAKGGLFINNGGLVMIQQSGAVRAAYMNGPTGKSIYPGFQTGFNIQYSTRSDAWSFGIGADYMGTKTQVNNYDIRRNGGIEALKLARTISDMVAGISVRYNISATGRKHIGGVKYQDIKMSGKNGEVIAADFKKQIYTTRNQMDFAIDEPGTTRTKMIDQSSCGPVTIKTTNPDGSVSETTFSCPEDAAQYNQRLSTNVTTPKQTQGQTFGEKVQQGLQSSGVIHRDLSARNILLGKVSRISGNILDIKTNQSDLSAENKNKVNSGGINATFYARDAESKIALGREMKPREKGTGSPTGERQYQPVYSDDAANTCTDCLASVVSNPLYEGKGNSGTNPLYEGKDRLSAGKDNDCDGISGLTVFLTDVATGAVLATTKTESCGEFFFANLPSGSYEIKVSGIYLSKKGYDISFKGKADFAGELISGNDNWQIELNTGTGTAEQAAALIKTKTKSNQSNDRISSSQNDNSGIVWSPRSNLRIVPVAVAEGTWVQKVKTKSNQSNDRTVAASIDGGDISWPNGSDTATADFVSPYGNRVSQTNMGITPPHHVPVRGIPIKGVGISLGKVPGGGCAARLQTDEGGNFVITNLEAGNYWVTMEQTLVIDDNTVLWVGSDSANDNLNRKGWDGSVKGNSKKEAQEFNTTRSNPERGQSLINSNGVKDSVNNKAGDEAAARKGWDGSVKGNSKKEAQDFNTTRSNPERGQSLINSNGAKDSVNNKAGDEAAARKGWDGSVKGNSKKEMQDFNSTRSNPERGQSLINSNGAEDSVNNKAGDEAVARKGWDGTVKNGSTLNRKGWDGTVKNGSTKFIEESGSNLKSMTTALDDLDMQLNNDNRNSGTAINNAHSTIKNLKAAITDAQQTLGNLQQKEKEAALQELDQKMKTIAIQLTNLQTTLSTMGKQYTTVSNVLKTKHDTVKNSISNIR